MRFIFFICFVLSPLLGHTQDWVQLEYTYDTCLKNGHYLQAVQIGKEMCHKVGRPDLDTGSKLAYCNKLIGNAFNLLEEYDSAQSYYDDGLRILEIQKASGTILASKILYNKALIQLGKEKYDEYFSLLTRSAKIIRELDYPEFPFSVWPIKKLYYYNVAIQDSTEYEKLLKECKSVYRRYNHTTDDDYQTLIKNIANDSILVSKSLSVESWYKLIETFSEVQQYDSVIYYCNMINIQYENNLISKTYLIKANLKLGSAYLEQRAYDRSLQVFLSTLDLIKDNPKVNNLIKFICYNNIGLCYYHLSHYTESEEYYRTAIKVVYDNWQNLSSYFPVAASNLSETLTDLGNYLEAKKLLDTALKVESNAPIPDSERLSQICIDIGHIFLNELNYVEAEKYFKKSIEIARSSHLSKQVSKASSSLSDAYFREGNYLEAIDLNKQSAELSLRAGDTVIYAFRLDDLCQLYEGLGQLSIADSFNSEARNFLKRQQNKMDYMISLCRGGMIKINRKNYDGALTLAKEADALDKSEYNGSSTETQYIYDILAACNYFLGNYQKAADLFKIALTTSEGKNSQINETDMLNLYCITLKKLKNYTELDTVLFYYANSSLRKLSTRMSVLTQEKKLGLLLEQQYMYNIYFSSIMNDENKSAQLYKIAYNIACKTKSYILNDEIRMRKFIQENDTVTNTLFSKLMQYKTGYFRNNKNRETYKDSIAKFENALSRQIKPFQRYLEYQSADFDSIVNSLDKQQIAIEIFRFGYIDDSLFRSPHDSLWHTYIYCALVAKRGWQSPKFVYLCNANKLNFLWEDSAKSPKNISDLYSMQSGQTNALYQMLLSPLEKYLNDVNSIFVAVTGSLNKINLTAIPDELSGNIIGAKYNIHYLGSTSEVLSYQPTYISRQLKSAIIFGGIDYDKSDDRFLKEGNNEYALNANPAANNVMRSSISRFGYLPGTLAEAKGIQRLFSDNKIYSTIDTGIYATEAAIKSLSGKKEPFVLHVATHGYFYPDPAQYEKKQSLKIGEGTNIFKWSDDPLLRSGLIFAGANSNWAKEGYISDTTEDGILTSYEISNLDLSNCQLVVLSACETGLGDINGSEGVYGLQRAFKMTGVKNIIMSLWKVPDKETQELMTLFYNYCFSGKSVHDALQAAQSEMRKKYPPYYWAGFKLLE